MVPVNGKEALERVYEALLRRREEKMALSRLSWYERMNDVFRSFNKLRNEIPSSAIRRVRFFHENECSQRHALTGNSSRARG